MKVRRNPILAFLALAAMAACGTPGAPVSPSLELPRVPEDLVATRKGNKVTLSWTASARTTDGQNVRLKKLGPTLVCRDVNEYPLAKCAQIVGQHAPVVPPLPAKGEKTAPPAPRIAYTDPLPADLQQMYPTGFATYAVQAMNWRWHTAGLSNQVRVPLAPVLPPPPEVHAKLFPNAIVVTFDCSGPIPPLPALSYFCRVYRKPMDGAPVAVQDVVRGLGPCNPEASGNENVCEIVDRSFEWETTYTYWVTPVTEIWRNGQKIAEVEGDDSQVATVFAHDVFPPSPPAGLQAVASGVGQKPFVDLTWIPNAETDLAGYNVYRQEPDQVSGRKLNSGLVTTPAFRDDQTAAGHTYTYVVSAVDARGNESARSQPASEHVP